MKINPLDKLKTKILAKIKNQITKDEQESMSEGLA